MLTGRVRQQLTRRILSRCMAKAPRSMARARRSMARAPLTLAEATLLRSLLEGVPVTARAIWGSTAWAMAWVAWATVDMAGKRETRIEALKRWRGRKADLCLRGELEFF